jgi:hypothetical protein
MYLVIKYVSVNLTVFKKGASTCCCQIEGFQMGIDREESEP